VPIKLSCHLELTKLLPQILFSKLPDNMNDLEISAIFSPAAQLETDFEQRAWKRARRLTIDRDWRGDVCEAFIRSPLEPHERIYKEFEVAPSGQWCDLLVDRSAMTHVDLRFEI
jgi:hypothetical protein